MSDSEEDWPEWNCFECHRVAVNSVYLDLQMLTKEHVILVDVNGEKWVQCMCNRRFHLNCTTNLPKNVEESDFADIYICNYCGWFMSGAYDSENATAL